MAKNIHAIDSFKGRVTSVMGHHQELMVIVHNNRKQAALETMLVEQFVMSIAVLWEAFLNDLISQYVAEQPKTFLSSLSQRIKSSTRDKFGATVANRMRIKLPHKVTREHLQVLLDPKGENIPINSADLLARKSTEFLPATHAKKFSLNSSDRLFYDFVFSTRNYLGHRSRRAQAALKDSAAQLDRSGVDKPLDARVSKIGVYLRGKVNGETRAVFIAKRLIGIAESLR